MPNGANLANQPAIQSNQQAWHPVNVKLRMIFRLSQKLNKKIKAGKLGEMPLDDKHFADWSAHLFTADRVQHIILTNTTTLYSCVMYGKGITDDGKFIDRALSTIRDFMDDDGFASMFREQIAPASSTVYFAKAFSRSVTGSMNDLIQHAEFALAEQDKSPHQVGFMLNETPMSALATEKSGGYGYPKAAFDKLGASSESDERITARSSSHFRRN